MKRAVETSIIACAGISGPDGNPIKLTLVPDLRETMSFKNTVASSPSEILSLIDSLKQSVLD
jgi:hypothetical protein